MKVNVSELPDVAREESISTMPTFKFYKAGKLLDQVKGANAEALKELIKKYTAIAEKEMGVTQMTSAEMYKQTIAEDKVVVVEFTAFWDPFSKDTALSMAQFAAKYSDVSFVRVTFE